MVLEAAVAAAEFNEETAPTMEVIPISVLGVGSFFSIWELGHLETTRPGKQ